MPAAHLYIGELKRWERKGERGDAAQKERGGGIGCVEERARFLPETLFAFSIKMGRNFESKNDQ